MGRPEDTAKLLKEGESPIDIALRLGISLGSVLGYLDRAVGQGLVRRTDIYFSVPCPLRTKYKRELARYANSSVAFGDLYEDLRQIELTLHEKVQRALADKYGPDESGWWRKGVPQAVRVKCQERREKDVDEPCDAYCYTDLLDLGKIMEEEWILFKEMLPAVYSNNKKLMLEHLARLNRVRNKVMHAARRTPPSEEDFDFVRECERNLGLRG